MNLFGLSPLVFAVGAAALVGGLALLHLLRVRLRRVEVDTLLFFRLAGAMQKPRVLPGKPARWLAFLLAVLAALSAWAAVAQPRFGLEAPSRFVVVEPHGSGHTARRALAAELATQLGPRGAVLAATWPPARLLAADEPFDALAARSGALRCTPSPAGEQAVLQAVRDLVRPGDQVVWVGERAPVEPGVTVTHVPVAGVPALSVRALQWERTEEGAVSLAVHTGPGRVEGELRVEGQVVARGDGEGLVRFEGVVLPAGASHVELTMAGLARPLAVPVPAGPPRRVFVAADLPAELARAVEAVLAVDAELIAAAEAATADVVVAAADDAGDPRPRLVLSPGVGDGPRRAVLTAASPAPCSLRDQQRRAASALPAQAWSSVWVVDAAQGGTLAAASAEGRLRVQIVDWLLAPITHADVPLLLATALRELAGCPTSLLALAGQPWAMPAAFGASSQGPAPVDGMLPIAFAAAGSQALPTVAGARTVHVLAPEFRDRAAPSSVPPAVPNTVGGDGSATTWLLLLLLLVLVVDAVLFHRGRLP